jgi:proteasome lid subunit RPN8/RPN11
MAFRCLSLPRKVFDAVIAHAQAAAPLECCGLLAGRTSADGFGRVEVESAPEGMFEAMRDIRGRRLEVLAVYHSHPATPPIPSRTDRERNYSEHVVNLIVSLAEPEPQVRGWWLTAHQSYEATCVVTDDEPKNVVTGV